MKHLFTIIITLLSSYCFAQKFSVSIDAELSVPEGDYKEISPDAGYGLRAGFFYRPGYAAPVKFGFEFGIQERGRATEYFSGYGGGFYNDYSVSATNNIVSLMFITRIQSSQPHKLKPFLDVTAGWNIFFSTVNVEDISYYSYYDPSYSQSSKANWAFTYGAAAGVDIPLNRRDDIGLELKVAYLLGSYTNYLTDPYINSNGDVSFQQNSSRTNMIIPQAGVRITIK